LATSAYSVAFGRQKTKFTGFWNLAFCDVANWQRTKKIERGCTTANLPLSNGIKTVYILQQLHGEIVEKRNGQTDRQTDRQKLKVLAAPGGG